MKALVFSDIHLDAVTAGHARYDEVVRFLDAVTQIVSDEKIDLVLFGGDATDPGRALEALYTATLLRSFATMVRLPHAPVFLGIAGNHDVVDTSQLFLSQPITTLTPLRAMLTSADGLERMHVLDRPHTRLVAEGWAVLALPYISRVHNAAFGGWEAHAFAQAKKYSEQGNRLIVIGHRIVPNAEMSSESIEMAKGQDMLLPIEEIAALRPAVVINGHYHKRQTVNAGSFDVQIPGSPLRFTFGEVEQKTKGVLILECT